MVPTHIGLLTAFCPRQLTQHLRVLGEVGPQERGLQVSSSSILSNPVSTVCGVYSNRNLLSSSGRLLRTMEIVYTARRFF